jgi:hypothetical protein
LKALLALDPIVTDISSLLYNSAPMKSWRKIMFFSKYAPDGSVSGHAYDYFLDDGTVDCSASPEISAENTLDSYTRKHWQLTQDLGLPRWYKMIVTVHRDGKFAVDLEYNENYSDEEMMRRG